MRSPPPLATMSRPRSPGRAGGLRGGAASRRAFTRPLLRPPLPATPPNHPNTPRSQLALECNDGATQGPYNTRSHGLKSDSPLWYTLATSRIIRSECPGKPSCNDADGGGAACSVYALVTVMRYRRPYPPCRRLSLTRFTSDDCRADVYIYVYANATVVIHSPA